MDVALLGCIETLFPLVTFTFDDFFIHNTMAHRDTDWVFITGKVGNQIIGPKYVKINGDLDNGAHPVGLSLPPVRIGPNTPYLFTYQIINNGHGDAIAQAANAARVAANVGQIIAAVTDDVYLPAAPAANVIAEVLEALGKALSFINSLTNCDGVAFSGAAAGNGHSLQALVGATGRHSYWSKPQDGPSHDGPLCHKSQYSMSWTISLTR